MQLNLRVPKVLLIAVALLISGGGFGVGGYLLGKGSVDEDEIRDEAFAEGEDAGRDEGYDSGFDAGVEEGMRRAKPLFTYDQGYKDGGIDVLGTNQFDYDSASQFIITVVEGSGGAPWTVDTWLKMDPGESYNVCSDDPLATCGGSPP